MVSTIHKIYRFILRKKLRSTSLHASRNIIYQSLLYFLYRKRKKIIKKTRKLQSCYRDDRCFILFTGTSIKDFDFNIIKGEKIIAAGMSFLHKDFKKCNTVAVFNPAPWEPRSLMHLDFISSCIYKNTPKGCHIVFDSTAYPYIDQVTYHRKLDTYYMSNNGNYLSTSDVCSDLHKYNNIQEGSFSTALGLASYMGFKEIYLLGQDFLTQPIVYGHFYDGFHETVENPSDYGCYKDRANMMIDHLKEHGCKVINVVKDTDCESFIDSVTFEDLKDKFS
jgi:hypothetical protein